MQVEPFAVGAAINVGSGGTVVGGVHTVFVAAGDVGVVFPGRGEGECCAGGVECPEDGGYEEELCMIAVEMLVKVKGLWESEYWDGRRVDLHTRRLDAIFPFQQGSYHAGFKGFQYCCRLGEAPVDRDAWLVGSDEVDLASSFIHFCRKILCNQRIIENSFVEDFFGFSGNGVRNMPIQAVGVLSASHDHTQMPLLRLSK